MKYKAALLAALVATSATAATNDEKRKLYALGDAGAEYCPQITTTWTGMGAIGYDMNADDQEYSRFVAEKKKWFETFRAVGSRAVACELLMQQYGPGANFELFKFK